MPDLTPPPRCFQVDWSDPVNQPVTPKLLGNKVVIGFAIEEVLEYIDWNPFFQVWQLRGRYPNRGYPKIFDDKTVGPEAKKLFEEAQVGQGGRAAHPVSWLGSLALI